MLRAENVRIRKCEAVGSNETIEKQRQSWVRDMQGIHIARFGLFLSIMATKCGSFDQLDGICCTEPRSAPIIYEKQWIVI